ncbi:MAG: TonB-dependent receptor [Bacteroidota bacterium]
MKKQLIYFIIFGLISNIMLANEKDKKGELSGKVFDKQYNDVLPFANITVKNSTLGTTTDFEGNYAISLNEGVYTVIYTFIGYKTIEITDVIIKQNESVTLNISLGPISNQLEEVIVKARSAVNTEEAILNVQRKSINLMDGISAQTFSKIGASNSAKAVKSVPGVSVQGGKYVYVRGLGDRYTKSILNGVDIPGLDPDRNTIQMDIFPTNILDNIQVVKSFTANYPADFTGGLVNIVTKDFPNKEEYSISVGAEYNPNMHFNSNYLNYKESRNDLLGFDNGKRDMPIERNTNIPPPSDNNPSLSYLTSQFNPEMKAKEETSFMNTNFGFTAANQFDIGDDKKIGFLASLSYRDKYIFFEDFENGNYRKSADKSVYELELDKGQSGDVGRNNILLSGLAGIAFKTLKSKYRLTGMHIQNGLSTAGYLEQQILFSDAVTIYKDNLEYKQSQISNLLLSGKHSNDKGSWNIEWKVSPTFSKIEDKDVRVTPFEFDDDSNTYFISPSSAGNPSRIWRGLEEVNAVGKLDFTNRHNLFNKKARLLFGGSYVYKQRDFSIDNYFIRIQGHAGQTYGGNADALLETKNIWSVYTKTGSFIDGNYEPVNTYDASQNVAAFYISEEFQITKRLKSILGIRFEKFDMYYTGQNNFGDIVYDKEKVMDKADAFPSANFIYALNDETNIRLSYGRTTARPSFKEKSITQIFDPLSSTTFNGNIDLQPTYIDNMDLRFEKYGEKAQMFAASAFFKNFTDPIELTYFLSATDQFQPKNLGSAMVYGVEFELRKNFGFISENLEDFGLNINASVINSELEMSEEEVEARRLSLREGEKLESTRQLQGQSPYLVNIGLNYANDKGWQSNLYYNVQGKTLQVVGTGDVPDAYTMPFHSLDFILNKSLGKNMRSKIVFSIKNLLDEDRETHYQSYKAKDQIFSKLSPGRGFSIGYSYQF